MGYTVHGVAEWDMTEHTDFQVIAWFICFTAVLGRSVCA